MYYVESYIHESMRYKLPSKRKMSRKPIFISKKHRDVSSEIEGIS